MIPLSSWLSCQWRHADKAAGYSSVLSAAQRLDDEVWERHRFKLMYLDDPCRFRDLSEKEIERANLEQGFMAHNGAMTNIQARTHAFLRGMGFQVAVVRTVESALTTLEEWGAPIKGRIAA